MTRPHGFTLVELMITIAVAAILMAIAVPSFMNLRISNGLTTQANELITAVSIARSEAIKRNRSVRFCRTTSSTATQCAGNSGAWTDWAVLTNTTAGGTDVIRRGTVSDFGGRFTTTSDLSSDEMLIRGDGLTYDGDNLIQDRYIQVQSNTGPSENTRCINLGAGSRISIARQSGDCS
ncbi:MULTISPECIES: GspH/FimT family pseudopilin [unclassified Thioalkalivibrio]|uniref:GspH/FimT family pseudopilin n=1 Tax=unclassified Thioalkalivibrio TaxID=2621013 RepID=UPI0009D93334|nr:MULTISPECIES: GspH/FimT family pseudopilin [unclassified Thioalkalivibrio]